MDKNHLSLTGKPFKWFNMMSSTQDVNITISVVVVVSVFFATLRNVNDYFIV